MELVCEPPLDTQWNDRIQCLDCLSFRNFLGFPDAVPDFTTFWKARQRLKEAGVEEQIWGELKGQLSEKGYEIEKGVIKGHSLVEADLGRERPFKENKAAKAYRQRRDILLKAWTSPLRLQESYQD